MRQTRDLPDPVSASEETGERADARKSWRATVTALLFASLYSSLHRLWVPLGLRFTSLADSPFARLDPAFLAGIFLWGRAHRRGRLGPADGIVAGGLVGFGFTEAVAIGSGHYVGWLALSHGISSLPMSLASFILLLHRDHRPSLRWAWTGAIATLLLLLPTSFDLPERPHPPSEAQVPAPASTVRVPTLEIEATRDLCGAQSLAVHVTSPRGLSAELSLEPCGFHPALLAADGGRLRLKNSGPQAANLHFVAYHGGTQRMGWNLVLRAGASMESPALSLRRGEVGLLYSDSAPGLGLALVVAPTEGEVTLRATRNPLGLGEERP